MQRKSPILDASRPKGGCLIRLDRDNHTHMRHDHELLRWFIPSTFVAMMVSWQATPAGQTSLRSAVEAVAHVLERMGHVLLEAFVRAESLDVLPAIPDAVGRWLIPTLIMTMIVVSLVNALHHEKLARLEQTVNSDRLRR
jgi:hypothetical protein